MTSTLNCRDGQCYCVPTTLYNASSFVSYSLKIQSLIIKGRDFGMLMPTFLMVYMKTIIKFLYHSR